MVCFPPRLCDLHPQYTGEAVSQSWPAPSRLLCVVVYVHTGQKHSHLHHVLIIFQQSVKDHIPVLNTNYTFTKLIVLYYSVNFSIYEHLIQLRVFNNTN